MRLNRRRRAALVLLLLGAGLYCLLKFYPLKELQSSKKGPYSVLITDRNGIPLSVSPLEEGLRREYIAPPSLPKELKRIILLSEDRRFYLHPGVDIIALSRSLGERILTGGFYSGASTITMQTARLLFPGGTGFAGKLKEMGIALCMEARLTKEDILSIYINRLPFGGRVEGIQSASRYFFDKPAAMLSPPQMCLLMTVPRNPSLYGGRSPNREALRKAALGLAKKAGLDSLAQEEVSRLTDGFAGKSFPFKAPHFLNYLRTAWPEELRDGQTVTTSLDLSLNGFIEERLNFYLARYEGNRLTNGAVLVVNNKTAEILAYVGSRNFFDTQRPGQIDGVRALNQPGSCLKPFLYAMALEKGYRPNTILPDIPLDLGGSQVYAPMNFNNRFNGPVRFRVALASSLNVTAVYLASTLGPAEFAKFLENAGFKSLESQRRLVGEGIAVGSVEVSLFEMVQAFSLFPRGGLFLPLIPLSSEKSLSFRREGAREMLSPYTAALICDILSDKESRILGFGPNPVFNTAFPSMFKTGTANQFQHIWALGATPEITVGVWLGNFTGETVIGSTGSSVPAAIAVDILKEIGPSGRSFFKAPDTHPVEICVLSGEKAGPACRSTVIEILPDGEEPGLCAYHLEDKGKILVRYPALFSAWAGARGAETPPGDARSGIIRITHPVEGAVFYMDPAVRAEDQGLRLKVQASDLGPATVYINGTPAREIRHPYDYFFPLTPGVWQITLRTEDARSGGTEASVSFEVKP